MNTIVRAFRLPTTASRGRIRFELLTASHLQLPQSEKDELHGLPPPPRRRLGRFVVRLGPTVCVTRRKNIKSNAFGVANRRSRLCRLGEMTPPAVADFGHRAGPTTGTGPRS